MPRNRAWPISHTVRFVCSFSGNPSPVVTWWKNGAPIETNDRIKVLGTSDSSSPMTEGSILITQGMLSDSGLYQCRAASRAGQAAATVRLLIEASGELLRRSTQNEFSCSYDYVSIYSDCSGNSNLFDSLAIAVFSKKKRFDFHFCYTNNVQLYNYCPM